MGVEIERKFLVEGTAWQRHVKGRRRLRQGYLSVTGKSVVRVRIDGDARAFLTVKTAGPQLVRSEFEYAIPLPDAESLLTLVQGAVIDKVRHEVPSGNLLWEIDVFAGENAGLVIAEVELKSEAEYVVTPDWLGAEITGDERYYNSSLVHRPYRSW